MFKNIVVAFITPKIKTKSFFTGLGLAKKFGASLTVIECVYKEPPKFHFFETKNDKKASEKLMSSAKKELQKLEKAGEESGIVVKTKIALTDSISDWVLNFVSSHKVDLLIIDHPHLSSFEETYYTDIINAIHHEARLPLLLLR